MIVKPNYSQEVFEGTYSDKMYNKNNEVKIYLFVKNKELLFEDTEIILSKKFPLNLVDNIYEFINSYSERGLLKEGKNSFVLKEHGGWGNNTWVTWFRPLEGVDINFLGNKEED